ncbi:hypothetical protein GCM10025768_21140 [Microbacterium pseudoresistens]|uniref:Uncharacterized membrane protein YvlD (DUF360 family) n=1 Tax=Microbacterium pseudoresistens TaxID=640634 RepID=A0A7Y9ET74_9MICO|nr:phage holin family protein [Microbacterium pseudoresistens]NYD53411.1 uncharacterized membrane protein YvlD (DUF360 family) [Microbacterium pseudoresistens]
MKTWVVRSVALYIFNVVVLLLIGLVLPNVSVGWHALWAAVVLTAVTLFIKPLLSKAFGNATKATSNKTWEKVVQYASVFVVALVIWLLTVLFSGVHVTGWFWGYVIPAIVLLIAWVIYDIIDDRVEAKAGQLYDDVEARLGHASSTASDAAGQAGSVASNAASDATSQARTELKDGLTPEQKRMLDDLN